MEPVPAEDPGLWNRPLGVLALATAAVCYILPCLTSVLTFPGLG